MGQTDREGVIRRPSLWKCFIPSSIFLGLRKMCRRGKGIRPHVCGGKLGAVGFLHASKHGPGGAARTDLLLSRRIPLAWQQGEAARPQDLQGPGFLQPLLNSLIYIVCGDVCKRCMDSHEGSMTTGVFRPWKALQIPAGFACLPPCVDTTGRTPIPVLVSCALELIKALGQFCDHKQGAALSQSCCLPSFPQLCFGAAAASGDAPFGHFHPWLAGHPSVKCEEF